MSNNTTLASLVATVRQWISKSENNDTVAPLVDESGWEYLETPVASDRVSPQSLTKISNSIAVISGKGGVGKTTTLLGLAGAAARAGESVLVVDLDPQGSLSAAARDGEVDLTVLAAFSGTPVSELVTDSVWDEFAGSIKIVAANRSLAAVDHPFTSRSRSTLSAELGELAQFDLVLIDAPATLSHLTFEAIALAEKVIVVAEPTRFSLQSAQDALAFAGQTANGAPIKLVLNKIDASEESEFRVSEIRDAVPTVVATSTISVSDEINYANGAGVPVQAIPGEEAEKAAAEFSALLAEIRAL